MRSHRGVAVLLVLFAAASCGDDDGGSNEPPVAGFAAPTCADLTCTFTDGSTDPDGNATIVSWNWDFGGDGTSDLQDPSHTFSAAGTYDVSLTVTDDAGASHSVTRPVMGNHSPTASFDVQCNALECSFTDTSTDPEGNATIRSWLWWFGDVFHGVGPYMSTLQNPTWNFAAAGTYIVHLFINDDAGASGLIVQDVTVTTPP
jgi:PKD repeat protein